MEEEQNSQNQQDNSNKKETEFQENQKQQDNPNKMEEEIEKDQNQQENQNQYNEKQNFQKNFNEQDQINQNQYCINIISQQPNIDIQNTDNGQIQNKSQIIEEKTELIQPNQEIQQEQQIIQKEQQQFQVQEEQKKDDDEKKQITNNNFIEITLSRNLNIPSTYKNQIISENQDKIIKKQQKIQKYKKKAQDELQKFFNLPQTINNQKMYMSIKQVINQFGNQQNNQKSLKETNLVTPEIKKILDKFKQLVQEKKIRKKVKQVGIEIFVDIDGTIFNDPSVHVALLLMIKDKDKLKYQNLIKNQEYLESVLETENLIRPGIENILKFLHEIKQNLPFIKVSIFTSNPQIKSYQEIIKQYEKQLNLQIFDNFVLAEKLAESKRRTKDLSLYSECTHSFIIDNNNTCKDEQLQNLIPVRTFSGIEYLTDKCKQFYLSNGLTQLELEEILIRKNQKHLEIENKRMQIDQTKQDWQADSNSIINQIQIFIDNIIIQDEKVQACLK